MADLLGHMAPYVSTEIQHQQDMNKCLCNAVKSGQQHTQIRSGHIQIMPKKNL
jgi:hypothetical protein